MKKHVIKWLCLAVLVLAVKWGIAQQSPVALSLKADSAASGNNRDIFSNFYQAVINDLTGPNKELKFTTNPYAIMLKANPALQDFNDYYRDRHWRALNLSVDAKLDSNYHFNGFASGITYAIHNGRDQTISKNFVSKFKGNRFIVAHDVLTQQSVVQGHDPIIAATLPNDLRKELESLFADPKFTVDQLSADVIAWIKKINDPSLVFLKQAIEAKSKMNIPTEESSFYDSVVQTFASRHLLTASIGDTTYKDKFAFKNVQLALESTKGFGPKTQFFNIEWDAKAAYIFADDTFATGNNLRHQYLDLVPGLNIVLKKSGTQQSFLEFKAAGEYQHIYKGQLAHGQHSDLFTLNGTLNIRIYNDIWIPLQFKWDPKTGNVFGLLNVTANFTALASLVKGQTSKN